MSREEQAVLKYWGVIVFVVGLALGGIVWGVRLEGRVNGQQELNELRYETLRAEIALLRQQQMTTDAKIDRLLLKIP